MSRSITITDTAGSLLDDYRKAQGGISYSRAIGRLLGYELRTRGQATLEAWKAYRNRADDGPASSSDFSAPETAVPRELALSDSVEGRSNETPPGSQTPVPYTETDGNHDE